MSDNPNRVLTAEQVLAIPEDAFERELIGGYLRKRLWMPPIGPPASAASRIAAALGDWVDEQVGMRGAVLCKSGFRLARKPDTFLTLDVAYISPRLAAACDGGAPVIEGVPELAVRFMRPGELYGTLWETIEAYLWARIPVTWVVDTCFKTITVHRPDIPPIMFNATQEIDGGTHLPGFRVNVADCF